MNKWKTFKSGENDSQFWDEEYKNLDFSELFRLMVENMHIKYLYYLQEFPVGQE